MGEPPRVLSNHNSAHPRFGSPFIFVREAEGGSVFCLFGEVPAFHDDGAIRLFGAKRVLDDFHESLFQLLSLGIRGV